VLPFEDTTLRGRPVPFVNIALVLLNALVFAYEVALSESAQNGLILTWGLVPRVLTEPQTALEASRLFALSTLVTSAFLHANLAHLAGNMLFLWVFGDDVEGALGHWTYLLFYLACGAAAGLAQVVAMPGSPVPGIGASGAIAGVLASYLLLFPHARVRALLIFGPFVTIGWIASAALISFWFSVQILQSVLIAGGALGNDNVAYAAHIGGFIAGVTLTIEIRRMRHQRVGADSPLRELTTSHFFRNWAVLALGFVLMLGLAAILGGAWPGLGVALGRTVQVGAGAIAAGDGLARVVGRRGILGSAEGLSRILAFLQLVLGASLILGALA
jgi:membrane associated rhomboid family serine protease